MGGGVCMVSIVWTEQDGKNGRQTFKVYLQLNCATLSTREGQARLQSFSQGVPNTIHVPQEMDQNFGYGPFKTQFLSNLD